jgi:hypothetical protein
MSGDPQEPEEPEEKLAPEDAPVAPQRPPAPKRAAPVLRNSLGDDEDDEDEEDEEATILYGRDAIDKLIRSAKTTSTPNPAMQFSQAPKAVVFPPNVELTKTEGPTAVPTTDSRDPSEELPTPQVGVEPGLGTGQAPKIAHDMPSGPSLGNPAEIVEPAELPDRDMMAQRVAMGLVALMGIAMVAYILSRLM